MIDDVFIPASEIMDMVDKICDEIEEEREAAKPKPVPLIKKMPRLIPLPTPRTVPIEPPKIEEPVYKPPYQNKHKIQLPRRFARD